MYNKNNPFFYKIQNNLQSNLLYHLLIYQSNKYLFFLEYNNKLMVIGGKNNHNINTNIVEYIDLKYKLNNLDIELIIENYLGFSVEIEEI